MNDCLVDWTRSLVRKTSVSTASARTSQTSTSRDQSTTTAALVHAVNTKRTAISIVLHGPTAMTTTFTTDWLDTVVRGQATDSLAMTLLIT